MFSLLSPRVTGRFASATRRATAASSARLTQHRHLKVHEYIGAQLMKEHGVSVADGKAATTPAEVRRIAEELLSHDSHDVVVKAQILAGGRGKGTFTSGFHGGVHIASSAGEAENIASQMLGHTLVTKQTGPKGKLVSKVLVTERLYIRRETYFAFLLDRQRGCPVLIGSSEGGVNIEEVAAQHPEKIASEPVDIRTGPKEEQLDRIVAAMGFTGKTAEAAKDTLGKLYQMAMDLDATQIEVNPFAELPDGRVVCLDAKLTFDDNARSRQQELHKLRDETQEDQREVAARAGGYEYIGLDGEIGCMVNGAGLAMATMDIIKLHGGEPANFLDLGGGATEAIVSSAFGALNSDPQVKAILVNIFGGIMRCDTIALGLIRAATEHGVKKPIVVRLEGTNVKEAMELLEESGMRMLTSTDLDDAAKKAVRVAQIVKLASEGDLNVKFELPV